MSNRISEPPDITIHAPWEFPVPGWVERINDRLPEDRREQFGDHAELVTLVHLARDEPGLSGDEQTEIQIIAEKAERH